MIVRGKALTITSHAVAGMEAERPRVRPEDIVAVLENPDSDDGGCAMGWRRRRTILVYYDEYEEKVRVRAVSATRRRLAT